LVVGNDAASRQPLNDELLTTNHQLAHGHQIELLVVKLDIRLHRDLPSD
jgi:hypothetical protein